MLLESLRQQVLHANKEIARRGLAPHTFGNASGIDRSGPQPAGRHQAQRRGLRHPDRRRPGRSPTSMERSSKARCARPATSTPTPCSIANSPRSAASSTPTPSSPPPGPRPAAPFPASAPPTPTTFTARFPVTEPLTAEEVEEAYVRNTGAVIVRRFRSENLDPVAVPGVLVAGHAPFAWGKTAAEAVEHADVLEYIARLAFRSTLLGASDSGIPLYVSEHHYLRKHGPKATYGQR